MYNLDLMCWIFDCLMEITQYPSLTIDETTKFGAVRNFTGTTEPIMRLLSLVVFASFAVHKPFESVACVRVLSHQSLPNEFSFPRT